MFKRKFGKFRKSGLRGVIPARKIPRSIARVRTDWVSVYNPFQGCRYAIAPYDPLGADNTGCISSFTLDVMSANKLSDSYGDDVKIVAMVGNLWMRPVFDNANICDNAQLAKQQGEWSEYFIRARGALFKQRNVNPDQGSPGELTVPGIVTPHPAVNRAWTDAGWLRSWERTWVTPPTVITQETWNEDQTVGCCGIVTRSAYITPATASGNQLAFTVPSIVTDCNQCTPGSENCWDGALVTRMVAPGWKQVSLSSRRTIHMHEDDQLAWTVDWGAFAPPAASANDCNYFDQTGIPCGMHLVPELKLKLQYG